MLTLEVQRTQRKPDSTASSGEDPLVELPV